MNVSCNSDPLASGESVEHISDSDDDFCCFGYNVRLQNAQMHILYRMTHWPITENHMSATAEQSPSLTRARHQIAIAAAIGAFWLLLTFLSVWFCGRAGATSNTTLLWLSLLHIVAVPWGLALLCLPGWYSAAGIVVFALAMVTLDGIALLLRVSSIADCFAACPACDFWLTFLTAGLLAISLAWLALGFRYAAQDAQERGAGTLGNDTAGYTYDGGGGEDADRTKTAAGLRKRPTF